MLSHTSTLFSTYIFSYFFDYLNTIWLEHGTITISLIKHKKVPHSVHLT